MLKRKTERMRMLFRSWKNGPSRKLLTSFAQNPMKVSISSSSFLYFSICSVCSFIFFPFLFLFQFLGLITEEEVRPFLNANFLSCRAMSKVIPHSSCLPKGASKAIYLVACLHRYEWIVKFAPRICSKRGLDISSVFGEEFQIAKDMVKLLPSKIDRMTYLGESGLSL
jgi:hypothetical protein